MKVLMCNNYYRTRAGEDISFDRDVEMLREYGHEVVLLTRDNANLDRVGAFAQAKRAIWSNDALRQAREIVRRERPDVMHCNNLFPQLSPSIHRAANEAGAPVVQAVRNYRFFCANSALYRDGQVCTDCVGRRLAVPAVRHACYRGSRLATGAVVAMQAVHRGTDAWARGVDAFFSPSRFARDTCAASGLPPDRCHVRTNFVHPDLGRGAPVGGHALFVGRLTPEKGVDTLAEAWREHRPETPLKVVGRGDEATERRLAAIDGIDHLGAVSQDQVLRLLGEAACLVFPSRWYETFGRSIAEAFSRGVPVVASDLGAMSELVEHERNGLLFAPGDASGLAAAVQRLHDESELADALREGARSSFEARFTREQGYDQLMAVYDEARRYADKHRPARARG